MKLSKIRDAVFGEYENYPDQCSYPYAVKAAWYEELVTCHVPIAPTWDASLKCDYDRIGDSRKRDKTNKKDKANPIRLSNLRRTAKYLREHGFKVTRVHVGKTRKGWHLRIWLDPYIGGSSFKGRYTVLKLQAMLGDDPFRQAFNASRVRRKRRGFNILFTSKIHNGVETSCEVFDLDWTLKVSKIFGLNTEPCQCGVFQIHSHWTKEKWLEHFQEESNLLLEIQEDQDRYYDGLGSLR